MQLPSFRVLGIGLLPVLLGAAPIELPPGESPEVVIPAATQPATRDPQEGIVQFHDLDNGMSVVVEPGRGIPVVAVQLWIQTGSVHEGPAERGSLVILEQLLRTRCEDLLMRGPPALRAAASSVEVQAGADSISLSVEAPSALLEGVLRALALSIRTTRIVPGEFERAHALALEQVRHLRTDGDAVATAALASLAFRVHPYRNQAVNQDRNIESRTRDDLEAFLTREFIPDRTSLVVVGKVDKAAAARSIIQEFGSWQATPPPARPKLVEPKLLSPRVGTMSGPDETRRLWVGFTAPPYRSDDAAGVSVLAQLLDPSSRTAISRRLLQILPEGTELRVHYVPARDPSLLTLRVTGGSYDQEALIQGFLVVLRQLTERGVTPGDLELAKQRIRNLAISRTQGYREQARALGLTKILSEPEPPRPVLERVLGLSPSDIQSLARSTWSPPPWWPRWCSPGAHGSRRPARSRWRPRAFGSPAVRGSSVPRKGPGA